MQGLPAPPASPAPCPSVLPVVPEQRCGGAADASPRACALICGGLLLSSGAAPGLSHLQIENQGTNPVGFTEL